MRRTLGAAMAAVVLVAGASAPAVADSGGEVPVPSNAQVRGNTPPRHIIEVNVRTNRSVVYVRRSTGAYGPRFAFRIASGQTSFPTPRGAFTVQSKVKDPAWIAPNDAWVPKKDRGKVFESDDPGNPLTGAWLGLGGIGVGFHGTNDESSLGTKASHGCLRMSEADVLTLYRIVELGTPVIIHG